MRSSQSVFWISGASLELPVCSSNPPGCQKSVILTVSWPLRSCRWPHRLRWFGKTLFLTHIHSANAGQCMSLWIHVCLLFLSRNSSSLYLGTGMTLKRSKRGVRAPRAYIWAPFRAWTFPVTLVVYLLVWVNGRKLLELICTWKRPWPWNDVSLI